jgi:hypothetical protein
MRSDRNRAMADRIASTPVRYPFSFAFAGDSGAWADPTADGIFGQLVRQMAALDPAPVFFANLGDFAGPGTLERHEHYLRLVEPLPVANLCVPGNHDRDDPVGMEVWERLHGPMSFDFAYGHTHFVAIDGVGGAEKPWGPSDEVLAFLDRSLGAASAPHRVVLTHMPPHLGGHYEPHPEWGFEIHEEEFLALLKRHGVGLVCCAHGLAFDHHVHDGIRFVMSGGGGTGLCSKFQGICTEGPGHPEDRGSLFHAVQVTIEEDGSVRGGVLQAFEPDPGRARLTF